MNASMKCVPRSIVLFVVLLMFSSLGVWGEEIDANLTPAPGSYNILAPDSVISFPFQVYKGDIFFRGEINGREVRMLLDDGFMWDQLLFWGSPYIDSLGLSYDGDVTIGDDDDPDAIRSRTASGITIKFPGVEFTEQTAVVTPYSSGVSHSWSGSEGQVSCTFLKHFVVDINFDKMIITLIEPHKFVYQGNGTAIPWQPMGFGPWSIPATLDLADGRSVSLKLMMDLGYTDQLQIATKGEHKIPVPVKAVPASLGFNIHLEETTGHTARVSRVKIGDYVLDDVVVSFVAAEQQDHTYHEVMVGLGLLSRFNLVFDYTRQRMFIEPNRRFAQPFEYNMSGMSLRPSRGDFLEVSKLLPNSPASEAGLHVGDKITTINGRPATEWTTYQRIPLMQQEGKTITLTVLRDGEEVEVLLKLRRLI